MLRRGNGSDLQTRRAAVTLIAFICNDAGVQDKLPQIFVLNEHVVTKADAELLAGKCQGNVLIVRRHSSWVNASFMAEVVDAFALCMRDELKKYEVVLHMDTLPSHMHVGVLRRCSEAGIHPHFVPAKTTGWLQPLDVAVFSVLKGWVVREVERHRLESTSGLLTRAQVLDIYRLGVDAVIRSRNWAHAFELTGLAGQSQLSKRLMDQLNYAAPPTISSELPKYSDFELVFPCHKDVPVDELFRAALAKEKREGILRLPKSARLPAWPS